MRGPPASLPPQEAGEEEEEERDREGERAAQTILSQVGTHPRLEPFDSGSNEIKLPAGATGRLGGVVGLVLPRVAMDFPDCSDRKEDRVHNNTKEKDAAYQRVASQIANRLRGSPSTLDAVSCTGALPNRGN